MSVRAWTASQVRALRSRLRMTQREFAAKMGVSQVTLSAWENDRQAIKLSNKARLDAVLREAMRD